MTENEAYYTPTLLLCETDSAQSEAANEGPISAADSAYHERDLDGFEMHQITCLALKAKRQYATSRRQTLVDGALLQAQRLVK